MTDGDLVISEIATHVGDGLYIASLAPPAGAYDLLIEMENDITDALPGVPLIVTDEGNLDVTDDRTVPLAATIESQPTEDVEIGT